MELDDFKNIRPGAYPASPNQENDDNQFKNKDMNALMENLKAQDTRDRKKTIAIVFLYIILTVVYTPMIATQQAEMKSGFSLLLAGFLLGTVYFVLKTNFFRKPDYSSPTLSFLKQTLKRFRFMGPADWIIVPVLLLILISGGALIVYGSFGRYLTEPLIAVYIYLGFMAGILIVAFTSSVRLWKKEKGAIIRQIQEVMQSFATEK